ncbi:MAG: L,D-transpeptidase family protein [Anaerolineae bacterium]|nr:L,D-transpeptidase family protein [Anaerolineae bacterium]
MQRSQHNPPATRVQRQIPTPAPRQPARPMAVPRQRRRNRSKWWILVPLAAFAIVMAATCAALSLGVVLIYNNGILPGVSAAGVELGGMSETEAATILSSQLDTLTVRDGDRTWTFDPAELGIAVDGAVTAESAFAQGRGEGNPIRALLGKVEVAPVLTVDMVRAAVAFDNLAPQFALPPVNAGVALVNGEVRATPAQDGRELNVAGLMGILEGNLSELLADGELELPMLQVEPQVTDASPMVSQAQALLSNPLRIATYDPITDASDEWRVPPSEWSQWLTAQPAPSSQIGLALTLEEAPLTTYLQQQDAALGETRYIDIETVAHDLQTAVSRNQTDTSTRVYHHDTQHTVQSGETIISIAWNYGVPYPWIQQANPGVGDNLSVGQAITIPSPDHFLEYPVVPNKRIVVDMSEQRTRVYENGQLKWDWIASTGIDDSPTWPGVYQILLHDPNAYASRWNLEMPWFLGVYRPVPGEDFTNGFHGFPTRGGSQLLWTNNLGTRVTYGCILLSSDNARLLYDWAEEGVVVVIQN